MCTGFEQFMKATGMIVKAFVCVWYSKPDHTHISIRPCSNLLNSMTKLIYREKTVVPSIDSKEAKVCFKKIEPSICIEFCTLAACPDINRNMVIMSNCTGR